MEPVIDHLAGIRSKMEPMIGYLATTGSASETDVLTKRMF